ncbi:MAG: four helix bundle protein [Clostridia bacterium]|nr:four helix bundle protein [Clostridia bacterium]
MKDNPLLKNAEQLAVDIESLCKNLEHKGNSNIIFQICKSSSSVFANITEAQYPQSLPDMLSKFKIARKECVETESWLKLLYSNKSIDEETFKKHRNLCGRIQRILTSSCITIEKKIEQK